jgi:hypothetical protein
LAISGVDPRGDSTMPHANARLDRNDEFSLDMCGAGRSLAG